MAQVTNTKLSRKANDHFNNHEWKEALSMYEILLMEMPTYGQLYPPVIISCGKIKDYDKMISFVELSENSGIPLDSLFVNTFALSMKIDDTGIYEKMLITVKEKQPWFQKIVNNYLLKYYIVRKENGMALEIADEILSLAPSNIDIMINKARILTDSGRNDEAATCMKDVLKNSPEEEEAILFLGNYYFLEGKKLYDMLPPKEYSLHTERHNYINTPLKTKRDSIIAKYFIPSKNYLSTDGIAKDRPYIQFLLNNIENYIRYNK
ncbi:MAG: tetratricopeptide repeat protein [Bacteroidales bacterium]